MKRTYLLLLCITLCLLFCGCSSYTYDNASLYSAATEPLEVTETIHTVDVDWVSGKVIVAPWDGTGIRISESADEKPEEAEALHYYVNRGTLYVRFQKQSLTDANIDDKTLEVLVPKTLVLGTLKLETISAAIEVDGISASNIEVETVSGKTEVHLAGDVRLLDYDTVSGDGNFSVQTLSHFEMDTTSADIVLTAEREPSDGSIESVSGDITLRLPQTGNFTLNWKSASGNVSHDLLVSGENNRYICGNGAAQYNIETVSGDLRIEKPIS